MKKIFEVAVLVSTLLLITSQTALAEPSDYDIDPEEVELASLDGESTDQVNEIRVTYEDKEISFELEGLDTFPKPLYIEIGGEVVSAIEEGDNSFRVRSESEVSEGEHTLRVVLEDRDERTILAETDVEVTEFNLEEDEDGEELDFDPSNVDIISIDGKDAEGVTSLVIDRGNMSFELSNVDISDYFFKVETGGESLGYAEEGEDEFRPHSDSDYSKGEQTLVVYVKHPKGGDEKVGETQVDVTEIDLEKDEPDLGPSFEPDNVEIESIEGENPDQVNELEIVLGERISLELGGVDEFDKFLNIELDGEILDLMEEPEEDLRPRTDGDFSEGKQTLEVIWEGHDERTKIDETEVDVVKVDLEPDEPPEMEFDPENVELESIAGEEIEGVTQLEIGREPVSLELENMDVDEHVITVKLDGETIGFMEGDEDEFKPRSDKVTEGKGTLTVFSKKPRGGDIKIAEKKVEITTTKKLDRKGVKPEDLEMEIVSVNGRDAEDLVVIEEDLRGEVPIEVKVDGLGKSPYDPFLRYKGDLLSPGMIDYDREEQMLEMDHLPRVPRPTDEENSMEELDLCFADGENVHVYDTVEVKFKHTGEDISEKKDGGVLNRIANLFGGGDEEEKRETKNTTVENKSKGAEGDSEKTKGENKGGVMNAIRNLFRF